MADLGWRISDWDEYKYTVSGRRGRSRKRKINSQVKTENNHQSLLYLTYISTQQLPLNLIHKFMFPTHHHDTTNNTTKMPSPRNSYASSSYSSSTTDTIRDSKQSASPKKDSLLQKTKKILAGPPPQPANEAAAARKETRMPTQAMMEKYGAGRGNIMGPH